MRQARLKEKEQGAYYHVFSRIIDRQMLLDHTQKQRLHQILRSAEAFCGVRILTYALLSNHWHLLVYVPPAQPVSDPELVRRLRFLYDRTVVDHMRDSLHSLRQAGQDQAAETLKARYTYRMYELSEFIKTLKQRFTQSYNRRHGRTGTLWEGRFKSILVQGDPQALRTIAAYIDLNAVRAGLVSDPKDYRFCGYAEAVAGSRRARQALGRLFQVAGSPGTWPQTAKAYRTLLYLSGEQRGLGPDGRPTRPGFRPEAVQEVLKAGGALSLPELLRCRVRYFTDALVIGNRAYVQDVLLRHRSHFGAQRRTGPRPMRGGWGDLCSARRLRLHPILVPTGP